MRDREAEEGRGVRAWEAERRESRMVSAEIGKKKSFSYYYSQTYCHLHFEQPYGLYTLCMLTLSLAQVTQDHQMTSNNFTGI